MSTRRFALAAGLIALTGAVSAQVKPGATAADVALYEGPDRLQKIVTAVDGVAVHSGDIQFEDRIRAEEADQFVRAGDFEERILIGFHRGGFRGRRQQLANQLFIARKKDAVNPDAQNQGPSDGRYVHDSFQNTTLPITSC